MGEKNFTAADNRGCVFTVPAGRHRQLTWNVVYRAWSGRRTAWKKSNHPSLESTQSSTASDPGVEGSL